jgi:ABC-type transport system involved in multi-copper enzyme maturation permease subunit
MTQLSTPDARANLIAGFLRNPVTIKELRSRMRGRRAFAVLTLYLLFLGGVVALVYLGYLSTSAVPGGATAYTAGKGLFAAVLAVQVVLVTFIGPAFTAGTISGERERQTFDLLRTTLLSPAAFVAGKLLSALSYIFLLVLVSIPLQSIAFLLGGLSPAELILSQLVILVAAVTYALYGLWCSAVMRSTLTATVATFAGMLFLVFGVPLLAFFFAIMLGIPAGMSIVSGPLIEVLLIYLGLALAATNLPAALITSEVFLLQQGTLFAFSELIGGRTIWIVSPWLLFIFLHTLAAVVFYWASVRRVSRISDV